MESVEGSFVVARIENAVGEEAIDFAGVLCSQRLLHPSWAGVLPDNLVRSMGYTMAAEERLTTKELKVVLNHGYFSLVVEVRNIGVGAL